MAPSAAPIARSEEQLYASSSIIDGASNQDVYRGYDHTTWYVGNAKQAASWYVTRMGFEVVAYQGLETGSRCTTSYVVSNNNVRFVLTSALQSISGVEDTASSKERHLVKEIYDHLERHGDAVKDVAFEVDDVHSLFSSAISAGATGVQEPTSISDKYGFVVTAVIKTFGETTHTFIDRRNYSGSFFPGFKAVEETDPIQQYLPVIDLGEIDHCVGNHNWHDLESACNL
jgi:4-hydroxyphenylpyruvate dioxygenase